MDRRSSPRYPTLRVEPSDTVGSVLERIELSHGIPRADQRLSFAGKPLGDGPCALADYGVSGCATLHLAVGARVRRDETRARGAAVDDAEPRAGADVGLALAL